MDAKGFLGQVAIELSPRECETEMGGNGGLGLQKEWLWCVIWERNSIVSVSPSVKREGWRCVFRGMTMNYGFGD